MTPLYGSLFALGRSSATVAFTPYSLSALMAAYEADAITGLSNGGAVASWTDSSGHSRTLAQVTIQ